MSTSPIPPGNSSPTSLGSNSSQSQVDGVPANQVIRVATAARGSIPREGPSPIEVPRDQSRGLCYALNHFDEMKREFIGTCLDLSNRISIIAMLSKWVDVLRPAVMGIPMSADGQKNEMSRKLSAFMLFFNTATIGLSNRLMKEDRLCAMTNEGKQLKGKIRECEDLVRRICEMREVFGACYQKYNDLKARKNPQDQVHSRQLALAITFFSGACEDSTQREIQLRGEEKESLLCYYKACLISHVPVIQISDVEGKEWNGQTAEIHVKLKNSLQESEKKLRDFFAKPCTFDQFLEYWESNFDIDQESVLPNELLKSARTAFTRKEETQCQQMTDQYRKKALSSAAVCNPLRDLGDEASRWFLENPVDNIMQALVAISEKRSERLERVGTAEIVEYLKLRQLQDERLKKTFPLLRREESQRGTICGDEDAEWRTIFSERYSEEVVSLDKSRKGKPKSKTQGSSSRSAAPFSPPPQKKEKPQQGPQKNSQASPSPKKEPKSPVSSDTGGGWRTVLPKSKPRQAQHSPSFSTDAFMKKNSDYFTSDLQFASRVTRWMTRPVGFVAAVRNFTDVSKETGLQIHRYQGMTDEQISEQVSAHTPPPCLTILLRNKLFLEHFAVITARAIFIQIVNPRGQKKLMSVCVNPNTGLIYHVYQESDAAKILPNDQGDGDLINAWLEGANDGGPEAIAEEPEASSGSGMTLDMSRGAFPDILVPDAAGGTYRYCALNR